MLELLIHINNVVHETYKYPSIREPAFQICAAKTENKCGCLLHSYIWPIKYNVTNPHQFKITAKFELMNKLKFYVYECSHPCRHIFTCVVVCTSKLTDDL